MQQEYRERFPRHSGLTIPTCNFTYLIRDHGRDDIYARTVHAPHKGMYVRRKDNTIVRLEVGSFIYQESA